ncbi:MAG: hypothetical protein AB1736_08455 [Chloroflexota bacterium]
MSFEWLKFLHVVTIIASVTLAEGSILAILVAARRRDVAQLRALIAAGETSERAANLLLVPSLLLGVAAALAGQISLTAPWLLASYVVLAVGFGGIGALGGIRHVADIKAAAAASPVDAPSGELIALLAHPRSALVTVAPPLIMATLVFLMVVKPRLW